MFRQTLKAFNQRVPYGSRLGMIAGKRAGQLSQNCEFSAIVRAIGCLNSPAVLVPHEAQTGHRFITGGIATDAMVALEVQEHPELAEKITILGAPSWLSFIHPSWSLEPWGQSKRYLPPSSRQIADRLFPNYPDDKLLMFGMMKDIIEEQRFELEQLGVKIISTRFDYLEQTDAGLFMSTDGALGQLSNHHDYHILHSARSLIAPEGMLLEGLGSIYSVAKGDTYSPIIVYGGGRNLYWACRDVGDKRPIIHVIPPGDRMCQDLHGVLHAQLRLENSDIQRLKDGTALVTGNDLISGKKIEMRVHQSQLLSAMGLELDRSIMKVPPEKVTHVDNSPNAHAIAKCQRLFSQEINCVTRDLRGTSVPPGSMILNFLKLREAMGKYDPSESNAVLLITAWENAVMKKAMAAGIKVEPEFFDAIENRIKHIHTREIPTESQVWTVIKNAYNKGVSDLSQGIVHKPMAESAKDGTPLSWETFKDIISAPTKEVLSAVNIVGKTSEVNNQASAT